MTYEYNKFYYKLAFMFNKVLSSTNSINPILIQVICLTLKSNSFQLTFFILLKLYS